MMSGFDDITPRRGTGSYKWDSSTDPQVLPLWVADMDFPTAPAVIDALRRRVDHGIFGYTLVGQPYYDALTHWFESRHGYSFTRERVIYTSGVVPALSAIIKALVPPGAGVVVQTPVYNCFFSSIRNNGCNILDAPLRRRGIDAHTFTYDFDYEALERECSRPEARMLLLCNPHNPAGRRWTRPELQKVADIAHRTGVRVVSDEIHCELTAPGTAYTPYGTVDPGAIVCLSPSKAFNTAGLQIANIVCPDGDTRAAIDRAININEVCDVNPFGPVALMASYSPEGEKWLDSLRDYLWDNWRFTRALLAERLPQCPVALLEATYLVWVDITALHAHSETVEEALAEEAKVWLNAGSMYGQDHYLRINIATPRAILAEGLKRFLDWTDARLKQS